MHKSTRSVKFWGTFLSLEVIKSCFREKELFSKFFQNFLQNLIEIYYLNFLANKLIQ